MPMGYGCRGRRGSIMGSYFPIVLDLAILVGILYILVSLFVIAAGYVIALGALIFLREIMVKRRYWFWR